MEALGVKMEKDEIDKLLEKTRKYLWRKKNAGGGFGMVCLRPPPPLNTHALPSCGV
jgi:hypothetical protein